MLLRRECLPGSGQAGPITLDSVLAREHCGIHGSFWALQGGPLNAPCSSSTSEPRGGSTVTPTPTPPLGKALAGSERSGGPGTQHRGQQDITAQLALTSLRKEQLYWSTGHITYNSPIDCAELSGFQLAVILKTWGKGDNEFCLLQISAGASAVSHRGER